HGRQPRVRLRLRDRGAPAPAATGLPRDRQAARLELLPRRRRVTRLRTLRGVALAAVIGAVAPTAGHAAPAIDDFANGTAGWTRIGALVAHTRREHGDFVLTLAPRRAGAAAAIDRS